MTTERKDFTDGLRAIADWYDAHPEIAIPGLPEITNASVDTKDEAAAVIRALGSCEKEYGQTLFTITKVFGSVKAKFYFYREAVCVKKVIGKKEIPEQILPAREETVIPAHTEEITEWECLPILAPTSEQEQA